MGRLRDCYIVPLLAIIPTLSSAGTHDCGRLRNEGQSWDLSPLDGPHTVSHSSSHGPTTHNTTYTLDICKQLKDTGCTTGTYVCGAVTIIPENGDPIPDGFISIAGNFVLGGNGHTLDPKVKRLEGGETHREGVRLELHGGKYPMEKGGENQQAVIDFICDRDRTGLEGEGNEERDENHNDENGGDDNSNDSKSLRFKSYGHEDGTSSDVLRLEWLTKYACEDYKHSDDNGSNHWGFFTWLIVLLFLCAAAYLIFGSWMNYNRYGARGWDMLPHSDTIRDIPYLMKDWGRRVVTTIQGPGSRGGYSAV